MSGLGRKSGINTFKRSEGTAPGRSKYKCNVSTCTATPRADDLSGHYLKKCSPAMLKKLKDCDKESDRNKLLLDADPHTKYLFKFGFSVSNLPTWKTGHQKVIETTEPSASRSTMDISKWLKKPTKDKSESDSDGSPSSQNVESDVDIDEDDEESVARRRRLSESRRWQPNTSQSGQPRWYIDDDGEVKRRRQEGDHEPQSPESPTAPKQPPPQNLLKSKDGDLNKNSAHEHEPRDINRNSTQDDEPNIPEGSTAPKRPPPQNLQKNKASDLNRNSAQARDHNKNPTQSEARDNNRNPKPAETAGADGNLNRNAGQMNNDEHPNEVNLSEDTMRKLALMIVKQMKIDDNEGQKEDGKECYIEGDDFIICRARVQFSHDLNVPKRFHATRVGHYGTFDRNQQGRHLNRSLNDHLSKGLHLWCVDKMKSEAVANAKLNEENEKAGKEIIWTVLHLLKHSGSSEDFVAMNDLNHLVGGSEYCGAVKNNSRRTFFELREISFEVLSEDVKQLFQEMRVISSILKEKFNQN